MENLSLTPVSLCSARQKRDIKSLSRSEMKLRGRPLVQYQFVKKRSARPSAVRSVVHGMILTSDPERSVNVVIQSKPLSSGKGPMKSIATESQRSSGTGKG